jgi:hypothetical protein
MYEGKNKTDRPGRSRSHWSKPVPAQQAVTQRTKSVSDARRGDYRALLRIDDYNHVMVIEHRAHIYRRREWTTPGRQHQRGQHHQKRRHQCDFGPSRTVTCGSANGMTARA